MNNSNELAKCTTNLVQIDSNIASQCTILLKNIASIWSDLPSIRLSAEQYAQVILSICKVDSNNEALYMMQSSEDMSSTVTTAHHLELQSNPDFTFLPSSQCMTILLSYQQIIRNPSLTKELSTATDTRVHSATHTESHPPTHSAHHSILLSALCAAKDILTMIPMRKQLFRQLEQLVSKLAPNLTAVLSHDSWLTASLIESAGGLQRLSTLSAGNVLNLGKGKLHQSTHTADGSIEHSSTASSSTASSLTAEQEAKLKHVGLIGRCQFVLYQPTDMLLRAARMLASKAVIAARIDAFSLTNKQSHAHLQVDDSKGSSLLANIEGRLDKLNHPIPHKPVKPIVLADLGDAAAAARRKRRGGRRARKAKEAARMTEAERLKSMLPFGVTAEVEMPGSDDNGDEMEGLGMLSFKRFKR